MRIFIALINFDQIDQTLFCILQKQFFVLVFFSIYFHNFQDPVLGKKIIYCVKHFEDFMYQLFANSKALFLQCNNISLYNIINITVLAYVRFFAYLKLFIFSSYNNEEGKEIIYGQFLNHSIFFIKNTKYCFYGANAKF